VDDLLYFTGKDLLFALPEVFSSGSSYIIIIFYNFCNIYPEFFGVFVKFFVAGPQKRCHCQTHQRRLSQYGIARSAYPTSVATFSQRGKALVGESQTAFPTGKAVFLQ
jgi:hypothetical protein